MRILWVAACAAMLLAGAPGGRSPARGEQDHLDGRRIEKIIYLPAKLAEQLGYFAAQGLEVELRSETAASRQWMRSCPGVQAWSASMTTPSPCSQRQGVQSVVQLTLSTGEAELVSARMAGKIRSPGDFAAEPGSDRPGSSTNFLTRYLALLHGVN